MPMFADVMPMFGATSAFVSDWYSETCGDFADVADVWANPYARAHGRARTHAGSRVGVNIGNIGNTDESGYAAMTCECRCLDQHRQNIGKHRRHALHSW
jgi:hypothetical protein